MQQATQIINKPECIPFVNERQMFLGIFWNIAGGEE